MKRLALFAAGLVSALTGCTVPKSADARVEKARVNVGSGRCAHHVLTDEGIGPLRIGSSVDSVRRVCTVLRDTIVTDMEGMPSRRLTIGVGTDSVEAEVVQEKVWRLTIASPHFETADSLGVGVSIARFKPMSGARAMRGEGAVYAAVPAHCGMSFHLTGFKPAAGALILANLPPSVTVLNVLIFGCHNASATAG